jgi:hypothetical protein
MEFIGYRQACGIKDVQSSRVGRQGDVVTGANQTAAGQLNDERIARPDVDVAYYQLAQIFYHRYLAAQ